VDEGRPVDEVERVIWRLTTFTNCIRPARLESSEHGR
jgi:hypothetical protein